MLDLLTAARFSDDTPRQIWATLLDEGQYCSVSTLISYSVLERVCPSFPIGPEKEPKKSQRSSCKISKGTFISSARCGNVSQQNYDPDGFSCIASYSIKSATERGVGGYVMGERVRILRATSPACLETLQYR